MKEINLHTQGGETTIRTGDAPKIDQAKSIKITGRLSAPFDFMEKKTGKDQYHANYCHLLIDKDSGTLTLHANEKSSTSEDIITGKLDLNPELLDWDINGDKRWDVREFIKFLRARKFYFQDPAENQSLIENLQKWNVSIERIIKDENNNTGNSHLSLETKVTKALEKNSFKLEIPVYKGYDKKKFTVEIGLDPQAVSVQMFLVSSDLHTLILTEKERLFKEELSNFDKLGFDCSRIHIS